MELVKVWWEAHMAQEDAQLQKNTNVDWKKINYPWFAPMVHLDVEDLKDPKQTFFVGVS